MKETLFTSMSAEKAVALLKRHTSPSRKESENHIWKSTQNPQREWACLLGKWEGNTFRGRLYRHFDGKTSGGIAMPRLTLKAESGSGSLGQIRMNTTISFSFRLFLAAYIILFLIELIRFISLLPKISIVSIIFLIGWTLLCAMITVLFREQYRHECKAITLILKTMTKAFDK